MALPRLLYNDLSVYTFSASYGTSPTGYELTNLNNYIPSSKWVGDLGEAYPFYFDLNIDLGSSKEIDMIVIENHNFDSCMTGSISVEYSDNSTYTSNVTSILSGLESSEYLYVGDVSPTVTKRYLRIHFTGSFYQAPYIGNIFVGTKLTFNFPYTYGYKNNNYHYETRENITLSGLKRGYQYSEVDKVRYELSFKYQNDTTRTNFVNFIKGVRGKALPFYYFYDTDNSVAYVNLESDYKPLDAIKYGLHDINDLSMITFSGEPVLNSSINIESLIDDDYVITVI